jgi:hypothetical protein
MKEGKHVMLPKILGVTFTAGFVMASFSASLEAASAAGRDRHGHVAVHRVHRAYAAHRWHHLPRRAPPTYGPAPNAFFGPGYVFVPGRGILDEDCDMPTSTCPNEYRDIQ